MCVLKVCGISSVHDARMCAEAGAALIGLNFYPPSPRSIGVEAAAEIVAHLKEKHPQVRTVAVFQNENLNNLISVVDRTKVDIIQLHGDEDQHYLAGAQKQSEKEVIRAVRLRDTERLSALQNIDADYILLDSFHPRLYGGTGVALDRTRARAALRVLSTKRVFLAGGINPYNVTQYLSLSPYGIDVNSGVERTPAHKDDHKVKMVMSIVRKYT